MRILVTGGAGFIGSHVCERLVERGHFVIALDNFDTFYAPATKRGNIQALQGQAGFHLIDADIRDLAAVESALDDAGGAPLDVVIHLAARAGVRPSIQNPLLYTSVNVDGTMAVLELARRRGVRRFVFGSSSSVYGDNAHLPFSEDDPVGSPISPYAATKRSAELLCHTYHHLYGLSVVCLRFFTVYGPRQRPDLAIHKFARLITVGEPVPMYGDGSTERDYTYTEDIVQGVEGAIRYTESSRPAFEIINLGGSRTTSLRRLVDLLGSALALVPVVQQLPAQAGDVHRTFANVQKGRDLLGYRPSIPIEDGIRRFVDWFRRPQARSG